MNAVERRALALLATTGLLWSCGGAPAAPTADDAPPVAAVEPAGDDAPAEAGPGPDWSKLPEPGADPTWSAPEAQSLTLSNGMTVWHIPSDHVPLVSLRLIIPRGAATDPALKAGLSSLTADLMDEGAGDRSALEISDALQQLATSFGAYTTTDGVVFDMNMLTANLEPSLDLLADILRRPQFPEAEFERRKAERIAQALAEEADPRSGRGILLRVALFPEGYGASPTGGVRHTLEQITLADVKAHYANVFAPEGASWVFVGGEAEALTAALEPRFGDWKGKAKATATPVSADAPPPAIYFVDYPGSTQSAIAIARRAEGWGTKTWFEDTVFNWVIGGAFTSRLNLNLREEKGYTYGARSMFNRWREAGFFMLAASVKADTTRASLDEMFKEIEAICAERPLSEQEFGEATRGMRMGYPARFETAEAVATRFADLPLYGRPADTWSTWTDALGAVSLEGVRAAAKRNCARGDYAVIVAGDRKSVAPTLDGLGLKIRDFDPQGRSIEKQGEAKP